MISLVTYTYNDHVFALAQLRRATALRPFVRERIVVDDGSTPPLRCDAPALSDVIVLTHDGNKGPAAAKRTGLNAASEDYILSVDCDIFFDKSWLVTALEQVARPDVGLVGGRIINKNYGEPVSKAQFYESLSRTEKNPVRFAPGGIWLLRRQVFHALGGMDDYTAPTHEDWHFCRKVAAAGLRIVINTTCPVTQRRRLRRKSYVLRDCLYYARAYRSILRNADAAKVLALIRNEVVDAVGIADRHDCPLLAYVRVAKFIRVLGAVSGGCETREGRGDLAGTLAAVFASYPQVLAALQDDCDLPESREGEISSDTIGLGPMVVYLASLVPRKLWERLERVVLPQCAVQEAAGVYDFHYSLPTRAPQSGTPKMLSGELRWF